MPNPNECGKCAHDVKNEDAAKGHNEVERDGVKLLVCKVCGEVCSVIQPTPGPTPAASTSPPVSVAPPQNVEQLAKEVAGKMATMRDEMILVALTSAPSSKSLSSWLSRFVVASRDRSHIGWTFTVNPMSLPSFFARAIA